MCVCVLTGEANVKLLSMSTNGRGPGGTLGAHTITLGIVQPHLRGTSPPPGWIYQRWLIASEYSAHPALHWVSVTAKRLLCVCVCVCVSLYLQWFGNHTSGIHLTGYLRENYRWYKPIGIRLPTINGRKTRPLFGTFQMSLSTKDRER